MAARGGARLARLLFLAAALSVVSRKLLNFVIEDEQITGTGEFVIGPRDTGNRASSGYPGSYKLEGTTSGGVGVTASTVVVNPSGAPGAALTAALGGQNVSTITTLKYSAITMVGEAGTALMLTLKMDDGNLLYHRVPSTDTAGAAPLGKWATINALEVGAWSKSACNGDGTCCPDAALQWCPFADISGVLLAAAPEVGFSTPAVPGTAVSTDIDADFAGAVDYLKVKSERVVFSKHCPITNCAGKCAKTIPPEMTRRVWTCSRCKPGFAKGNDGRSCVCLPGKYEIDGASHAMDACSL